MWNHENRAPALEGLSLELLTRVLGWQKEEVEAFLVDVKKYMKDTKIHAFWTM